MTKIAIFLFFSLSILSRPILSSPNIEDNSLSARSPNIYSKDVSLPQMVRLRRHTFDKRQQSVGGGAGTAGAGTTDSGTTSSASSGSSTDLQESSTTAGSATTSSSQISQQQQQTSEATSQVSTDLSDSTSTPVSPTSVINTTTGTGGTTATQTAASTTTGSSTGTGTSASAGASSTSLTASATAGSSSRTIASSSESIFTSTFTSTYTNADGSTMTSTGTTTLQTAVSNASKSSTGKTWGIVGGVVGGIVGLCAIIFLVYKLTQKRFKDLDVDQDEIKWPELQPDGQEMSAVASTLNPLGTHPTGRAGFGDDNDGGSEWGGDGDLSANGRSLSRLAGTGGRAGAMTPLTMDGNSSYEQLGLYDAPGTGQAYYDDPYLGQSAAPYPPPRNIYTQSSPQIPPGAYAMPSSQAPSQQSHAHSASHSSTPSTYSLTPSLPPLPQPTTASLNFSPEEIALNGSTPGGLPTAATTPHERSESLQSAFTMMSDPFRRSGTPLEDVGEARGRGPLGVVNGRPDSVRTMSVYSTATKRESQQA